MPLVVFVLLLLLCIGLLGLACACLDDTPALAFDRALQTAALPVIGVWAALILASFASALLALVVPARDRASPAFLQRFLF
jgi:Asp/Glu/hydantoin racemase